MDFLEFDFNQRALLAAAIIGFANGYLSGYIVLRKTALMIGSLSHALLPGIAVGILVAGFTATSAFVGALVAALIVGLGAVLLSRTSRIDGNTALAILYTASFSAGVVLLDRIPERVDLDDWLFGNILGLTDGDLIAAFVISLLVLGVLTLCQRPLLLTIFEPAVAHSQGVPIRTMNYLLMGLTILALVTSLQAVGCILSLGLLVAPAATVFQFANSPRTLLWGGGVLGSVTAVFAVIVSNLIDVRTGAVIVLLLGLEFLVAYLFSPKYGLFSIRRSLHPRHNRI